MAKPKRWTRDELLIALNLYHKLRFGQMHAKNPAIADLAAKLGRSANSLALKLVNLASIDPALRLQGKKGMANTSALDRATWAEFHENLNETVPASEEMIRRLFAVPASGKLEVLPKQGIRTTPPTGPTEATAAVKVRRGQDYFREAVLNNFGGRCGVTGLPVRELLIASHILPWGKYPRHRLVIANGLCLSRLHDAAFDRGFITFDDDLRLILSPALKERLPHKTVAENFGQYAGCRLQFPDDATLPEIEFLAVHRSQVFAAG